MSARPHDHILQQKQKTYKHKKGQYNKGDSLLEHLLAVRGIDSMEAKEHFLSPNFEAGIHDPFLLKDMQRVVDRIMQAIDSDEKILIYSDYDADGLPGSAIMHDLFNTIGYTNVSYITPDRHTDGFGLHTHIVSPFIQSGTTLIMTIDCGIADISVTSELAQKYPVVDIIITDHHLPAAELPNVFAILNPKQADCNYPEKMLCGAGVVWKLVSALVWHVKKIHHPVGEKIKNGYEKWLLDLAGMATLSDMVPLKGENRIIAYYGLIVLRKTKRPGLRALCTTNNLELYQIVEEDVTFTLSPRINVASRLANPKLALDVLTTKDYDRAITLAKELNQINTKRKTMVAQTVKQAMKLIVEKYPSLDDIPLLVLGNPDWKPPILGLVATHIIKHIPKPVWIWGRSDDGILKGSIRSVSDIDVVHIMSFTKDGLFINKGGHAMSGGFSILQDKVFELETSLVEAYEQAYRKRGNSDEAVLKHDNVDTATYFVDAELLPADIHAETHKIVSKLAPFGVENEKPLFAITDVVIQNIAFFGKTKEHLQLDCGHFKAIQFFATLTQEQCDSLRKTKSVTLIGHVEKNQFRGASDIRIRLVDIV